MPPALRDYGLAPSLRLAEGRSYWGGDPGVGKRAVWAEIPAEAFMVLEREQLLQDYRAGGVDVASFARSHQA
eukprot:10006300-Alexandrium_andersonii.AAC.1